MRLAEKRIALYPGSFDPMTLGHLDIIERLCALYDEVVVALLVNPAKKPYLTQEERLEGMENALAHLPNARVIVGSGATVEVAKAVGAKVMARGLRSVTDFEYETALAAGYRYMDPDIETIMLLAKPELGYISSSIVRDIHALKGDVTPLVPPAIYAVLQRKAQTKGE